MRSGVVLLGAMAMTLTLARPSAGAEGHGVSPGGAAEPAGMSFTGTVVETTNASRYTYVRIDTGGAKIWAAAPAVAVKVGDKVSIAGGMPAKDFYSPTLKRKFGELYFATRIVTPGSALPAGAVTPTLPAGHPTIAGDGTAAVTDFSGIRKPAGGKTVAEIWAEKATLSGKQVVVCAKVVKVVPNVMGLNFLHLRDGTGREGENDLPVTTKAVVKVGAVVTASGVLSTGKDYGSGYKYDAIMDDASVTEK